MRQRIMVLLTGLAVITCTIALAEDAADSSLPPELFPDRDVVTTPVPEDSQVYTVRQAGATSDEAAVLMHLKIYEEVRGQTNVLSRPVVRTLDGQKAILQVASGDRILGVEIEPHVGTGQEQAEEVAEARREMKLQRALLRRIAVDFDDVPLKDAVAELARRCDVNFLIDPAGLAEEGQSPDRKIKFSVSGARLSTILDEILSPLLLDYAVTNEVIKITSQSRARGELITVTYPVADLLAPPQEGQALDVRGALDQLMKKVARRIAPTSWNQNGGWGSIHAFNATQSLVVRQVPDIHDEISLLLRDLRKKQAAKGEPLPMPAPVIP